MYSLLPPTEQNNRLFIDRPTSNMSLKPFFPPFDSCVRASKSNLNSPVKGVHLFPFAQ